MSERAIIVNKPLAPERGEKLTDFQKGRAKSETLHAFRTIEFYARFIPAQEFKQILTEKLTELNKIVPVNF